MLFHSAKVSPELCSLAKRRPNRYLRAGCPTAGRRAAQGCQDLQTSIIKNLFYPKAFFPGACIIKLIMAIIYSFHNKLEYMSLANISSLVQCLGTNALAYYGNCKLWP